MGKGAKSTTISKKWKETKEKKSLLLTEVLPYLPSFCLGGLPVDFISSLHLLICDTSNHLLITISFIHLSHVPTINSWKMIYFIFYIWIYDSPPPGFASKLVCGPRLHLELQLLLLKEHIQQKWNREPLKKGCIQQVLYVFRSKFNILSKRRCKQTLVIIPLNYIFSSALTRSCWKW